MTLDNSMLARMKLVLVQSLGVIRIVASVSPLTHKLNTARMRKIITLAIIEVACDARAVPVSAVSAVSLFLSFPFLKVS